MAKAKSTDLTVVDPQAVSEFDHDVQAILPAHYRIKETKSVTRPVMSQVNREEPFVVTIESQMVLAERFVQYGPDGKELPPDPNNPPMNPPWVCNVIDLQDQTEKVLICNAQIFSGLKRNYPNDSYVGRSFAMISKLLPHPNKTARQMRAYAIRELIFE
jgi:hypothetical protein